MNRLTRTAENFDYCRDFCGDCKYPAEVHEKCLDARLYEKLRDYEDAEAEGRLIVLPETVYMHDAERIYESRIRRVIYETDTGFAFDDRAVGKTVFLTRKEAEAALSGGADG